MAGGAGVVQQFLVLQGADQIVALVARAVGGGGGAHMAVGAGELVAVDAALSGEGLQLGVVDHELADAVGGIDVVSKDLAVHHEIVVVVQDGIGVHALQAGIGERGGLGLGCEVVVHMALAAGEGGRVDHVDLVAQGFGQIGVGHDQIAARVGMAVKAAERLVDLLQHVLELQRVGRVTHLDGLGGHDRGLAGEAVGQGVGTAGAGDVLDHIGVTAGASVVLGEAVALKEGGNHRVVGHIVLYLGVLAVLHIALVNGGILLGPVRRREQLDAGAGGDQLGRGLHLQRAALRRGKHRADAGGLQRVSFGLGGHGAAYDIAQKNQDQKDAAGRADPVQKFVVSNFHHGFPPLF